MYKTAHRLSHIAPASCVPCRIPYRAAVRMFSGRKGILGTCGVCGCGVWVAFVFPNGVGARPKALRAYIRILSNSLSFRSHIFFGTPNLWHASIPIPAWTLS